MKSTAKKQEPYEQVTIDVEEQHQGSVMEALGIRKGEVRDMMPDGKGRVRLEYIIPSRGLIGFRGEFMTMTSGTGYFTLVSITTMTSNQVKSANVKTVY